MNNISFKTIYAYLDASYILVAITTVLILSIVIYIIRIKDKEKLHYAFLGACLSMLVWNVGIMIEYKFLDKIEQLFFLEFSGTIILPVFILLLGYFYANPDAKFTKKLALLFIIPIISIIMTITNPYHHLFLKHYSIYTFEAVIGDYFAIHTIYSYLCIVVGLFFLFYAGIKKSGFFSRQVIFVLIGTAIPVVLNGLSTTMILPTNQFFSPITFSIAMMCFWYAIIKFDFLNVVPVAMQKVVDHISDGFVVLSKELMILDFNKAFSNMFKGIFNLQKNEGLLSNENVNIDKELIKGYIDKSINKKEPVVFEKQIIDGAYNKYFTIEVTPMFSKVKHIGTIMLFKDITMQKNHIKELEEKNIQLDQYNEELQAQNEEIADLNKKLKEAAETDGLTGAYNRRFFNEYFDIEVTRALNQIEHKPEERNQMNFGIAILDIDDFKKVNDTYGHLMGDEVLRDVVKMIKEVTFSRDIVCRYGGEEFAIIFTKTSREGAIIAAEKIRERVANHKFAFSSEIKDGHVTVSIGFASFDDDYGSGNNVLQVADERLYKAKKTGKNKVVSE